MREIRHINPRSVFKIGFVVYILLGFIFSIMVFIFGNRAVGEIPFATRFGQFGVGVVGVVLGTVIYGVVGAASWGLGAVVYNFLAKRLGGIKVELV